MGYGRRLGRNAKVVQIDLDYRTVGKNRDVELGLVGRSRRDPRRGARRPRADASTRASSQRRREWMQELRKAEEAATEKLMPLFRSDSRPIHPYRVAWELNEFLTDDTIYIGDGGDVVTISAQAVRPQPARQLDGPGRARQPRHRHRLRARGQARASAEGGAVLLRRRLVRHDRVRHGDGEPLQGALYRRHRQ